MIKLKPVRHVAMIRPEEVDDKSSGGMYIPDAARDRMQVAVDRGELVAVGDGFFENLPGPVPQIGDYVLFDRYAGSLIVIGEGRDRVEYRLCNDDKIVAIMEGGTKK
jgi:chaperonin GroES